MAFASVIRNINVSNDSVVQIAVAEVLDIVADALYVYSKKPLPGTKVAELQQKMRLGANRSEAR